MSRLFGIADVKFYIVGAEEGQKVVCVLKNLLQAVVIILNTS